MLTKEIASEIVHETMQRVQRNINIMDEHGIIIGSGDPHRIGQFHAAALEVIGKRQLVVLDECNATEWRGAQPGVNLPIFDDGEVVGVIGITGTPEEVEPIGLLIQMTAELMLRQSKLQLRKDWRRRTIDAIVSELILDSNPNFPRIEKQLLELQIILHPPYRWLVLTPRDESFLLDDCREMAASVLSPYGLIGMNKSQQLVILCSSSSVEDMQAKMNRMDGHSSFFIGCSGPAHQWKDVSCAYKEAQLASTCAVVRGTGAVYYELAEAEVLSQVTPQVHQMRLLGKLGQHLDDRMCATLECLFRSNLNVAEAVRELGIHRNTMLYRLARMKEVSGYDPLNFNDAIVLQWTLWMRRSYL